LQEVEVLLVLETVKSQMRVETKTANWIAGYSYRGGGKRELPNDTAWRRG